MTGRERKRGVELLRCGRAAIAAAVLWGAALLVAYSPVGAQAAPQKNTPKSTASGSKPAVKSSQKRQPVRRRRARGQMAPTPERIREIQSALARTGHYAGEPTGKWDAASVEAMKRFQEANGLKPTGKLDARSLQLLGLGSQVAGLAPPRPSVDTATSPQ